MRLATIAAAIAVALAPGPAEPTPTSGKERATTPVAVCLECHGDMAHGHPTEIRYSDAVLENRELARPETLPPQLPLVDGKVACTTCHDGASTEKKYLALPQRQLCLACHPM
jgi:predicted CXXCH cytochrome family protein